MNLRGVVTSGPDQRNDNLPSRYLRIYTAISLADESGRKLVLEGEDNRTRLLARAGFNERESASVTSIGISLQPGAALDWLFETIRASQYEQKAGLTRIN